MFNTEQTEEDPFLADNTTLPTSSAIDNQSRFVLQTVPRNRNSISLNVNPNINPFGNNTFSNTNNNNNQRQILTSESTATNSPMTSPNMGKNPTRSNSQKSVTRYSEMKSRTILRHGPV